MTETWSSREIESGEICSVEAEASRRVGEVEIEWWRHSDVGCRLVDVTVVAAAGPTTKTREKSVWCNEAKHDSINLEMAQ